MSLLYWELKKRRRLLKKSKDSFTSKKIENKLYIELKDKLESYLDENDKVMIEVPKNVLGEFGNILSAKLLSMYDFEQIDVNKFIFYNKEISI